MVPSRTPEVRHRQQPHRHIGHQSYADGVHIDPLRLMERRGVFVSFGDGGGGQGEGVG